MDGFRKLLADEVIAPREFAVACKRLLDAIGVAAAQRPCRVPRQQSLDLVALRLFVDRVHGQPLSIPAALSSSASPLRAENMRVLTVFSGMPTMSATSSTDFSW